MEILFFNHKTLKGSNMNNPVWNAGLMSQLGTRTLNGFNLLFTVDICIEDTTAPFLLLDIEPIQGS